MPGHALLPGRLVAWSEFEFSSALFVLCSVIQLDDICRMVEYAEWWSNLCQSLHRAPKKAEYINLSSRFVRVFCSRQLSRQNARPLGILTPPAEYGARTGDQPRVEIPRGTKFDTKQVSVYQTGRRARRRCSKFAVAAGALGGNKKPAAGES